MIMPVNHATPNPSLYQINTRVWLTELGQVLGRPATLDDIPDTELDQLSRLGMDWVWLLSVWQTGLAGRQISRNQPQWRREFQETLPDLHDEDIAGSGFAITAYQVSDALGGDLALARLRKRLQNRGLRLMLDFVPNHSALDHPWVAAHPEFYVAGNPDDLAREPQNYVRIEGKTGSLILAHGRDPYFPGWPDTLQLDYSQPDTQEAMIAELKKVASCCDGVRCDMAMLLLPEVFKRTWGKSIQPFWPGAIQQVREQVPNFCFMAEVYWDLEWTLQQQGFDYTYDKRLYDRLRDGRTQPIREHFYAGLDFQNKLARFLENHDEPRAAATFATDKHQAAAVVTYLSPGLRFFQQGQFAGYKKHISPHLCRGPKETADPTLEAFYQRLLAVLRQPLARNGNWQLLECTPAWDGNWTSTCFLAFSWSLPAGDRLLVAINYAPNQSQCYVRLPFDDLASSPWRFQDQLGSDTYDRNGSGLRSSGLFLDMPPRKASVFSLSRLRSVSPARVNNLSF
jgi:glycosidase